MRRRLRATGQQVMARRPEGDGRAFNLSPRALRIGGWIVALALIVGIAVVVNVLGGDGEDGPIGSAPPSGAASAGEITFGTSLETATGEVPAESRTNRFTTADTFAYSVAVSGTAPDPVWVEVRRTGGGAVEIVQAVPDGEQDLEYPGLIAFDVPADDLFEVFGPGEYLMLVYADPEGDPIAEGSFVLVGGEASPSADASASP